MFYLFFFNIQRRTHLSVSSYLCLKVSSNLPTCLSANPYVTTDHDGVVVSLYISVCLPVFVTKGFGAPMLGMINHVESFPPTRGLKAPIPLGFICDQAIDGDRMPTHTLDIYKTIFTVRFVNAMQCNLMQCNRIQSNVIQSI